MERFDSPFGPVELTPERFAHITDFHPEVKKLKKYFVSTIANPELIRPSRSDKQAFILYYKVAKNKFLAVVIKTNARNFILTAYLTSKNL